MGHVPDPRPCPICGKDVKNVVNHVRMRDDEAHAPILEYPAEFDGEF